MGRHNKFVTAIWMFAASAVCFGFFAGSVFLGGGIVALGLGFVIALDGATTPN